MEDAQELIWGLLKLALVAAGVFYAVQVLIAYAREGSLDRPQFDGNDKLRSSERVLVWAGVMAVWMIGRLAKPLVNMLSEASAEVGEWAISRRRLPAVIRPRMK